MLRTEDSGIDSDPLSNSNGASRGLFSLEIPESPCSVKFSDESPTKKDDQNWDTRETVYIQSDDPAARLMSTAKLQKRLEKQILQAKKLRQQEQANEGVPKKLIPRNRLKVPKSSQPPIVTKADSHPLVSWESESDDDDKYDFYPMTKKGNSDIMHQLIKDGYNVDLTPDDEDLDLIPPKPLERRCTCCNLSYMCHIQ